MDTVEKVARALCDADDGGVTELIFQATEHRGDCTKEAFTCALCQVEMYTEQAVEFAASLKEKGLVIVPREPTADMKAIGVEGWLEEKTAGYIYRSMIDAAPKTTS